MPAGLPYVGWGARPDKNGQPPPCNGQCTLNIGGRKVGAAMKRLPHLEYGPKAKDQILHQWDPVSKRLVTIGDSPGFLYFTSDPVLSTTPPDTLSLNVGVCTCKDRKIDIEIWTNELTNSNNGGSIVVSRSPNVQTGPYTLNYPMYGGEYYYAKVLISQTSANQSDIRISNPVKSQFSLSGETITFTSTLAIVQYTTNLRARNLTTTLTGYGITGSITDTKEDTAPGDVLYIPLVTHTYGGEEYTATVRPRDGAEAYTITRVAPDVVIYNGSLNLTPVSATATYSTSMNSRRFLVQLQNTNDVTDTRTFNNLVEGAGKTATFTKRIYGREIYRVVLTPQAGPSESAQPAGVPITIDQQSPDVNVVSGPSFNLQLEPARARTNFTTTMPSRNILCSLNDYLGFVASTTLSDQASGPTTTNINATIYGNEEYAVTIAPLGVVSYPSGPSGPASVPAAGPIAPIRVISAPVEFTGTTSLTFTPSSATASYTTSMGSRIISAVFEDASGPVGTLTTYNEPSGPKTATFSGPIYGGEAYTATISPLRPESYTSGPFAPSGPGAPVGPAGPPVTVSATSPSVVLTGTGLTFTPSSATSSYTTSMGTRSRTVNISGYGITSQSIATTDPRPPGNETATFSVPIYAGQSYTATIIPQGGPSGPVTVSAPTTVFASGPNGLQLTSNSFSVNYTSSYPTRSVTTTLKLGLINVANITFVNQPGGSRLDSYNVDEQPALTIYGGEEYSSFTADTLGGGTTLTMTKTLPNSFNGTPAFAIARNFISGAYVLQANATYRNTYPTKKTTITLTDAFASSQSFEVSNDTVVTSQTQTWSPSPPLYAFETYTANISQQNGASSGPLTAIYNDTNTVVVSSLNATEFTLANRSVPMWSITGGPALRSAILKYYDNGKSSTVPANPSEGLISELTQTYSGSPPYYSQANLTVSNANTVFNYYYATLTLPNSPASVVKSTSTGRYVPTGPLSFSLNNVTDVASITWSMNPTVWPYNGGVPNITLTLSRLSGGLVGSYYVTSTSGSINICVGDIDASPHNLSVLVKDNSDTPIDVVIGSMSRNATPVGTSPTTASCVLSQINLGGGFTFDWSSNVPTNSLAIIYETSTNVTPTGSPTPIYTSGRILAQANPTNLTSSVTFSPNKFYFAKAQLVSQTSLESLFDSGYSNIGGTVIGPGVAGSFTRAFTNTLIGGGNSYISGTGLNTDAFQNNSQAALSSQSSSPYIYTLVGGNATTSISQFATFGGSNPELDSPRSIAFANRVSGQLEKMIVGHFLNNRLHVVTLSDSDSNSIIGIGDYNAFTNLAPYDIIVGSGTTIYISSLNLPRIIVGTTDSPVLTTLTGSDISGVTEGMAISGNNLYYGSTASTGSSIISRYNLSTSTRENFWSVSPISRTDIFALAVDSTYLYYSTWVSNTGDATIRRVLLTTPVTDTIFLTLNFVSGVATPRIRGIVFSPRGDMFISDDNNGSGTGNIYRILAENITTTPAAPKLFHTTTTPQKVAFDSKGKMYFSNLTSIQQSVF